MARIDGILVTVKNYPLPSFRRVLGDGKAYAAFRDECQERLEAMFDTIEVTVVTMNLPKVVFFDIDVQVPKNHPGYQDASLAAEVQAKTLAEEIMRILDDVAQKNEGPRIITDLPGRH